MRQFRWIEKTGLPIRKVAKLFRVSDSGVSKWTKRYRETGSFAPGAACRPPRILAPHEELIRGFVVEMPDMTITQLRADLQEEGVKVGRATVRQYMGNLGL